MGVARKRKTPGFEANDITELPSLSLTDEKMDVTRLKQCLTLLKMLMEHQFGWVFNYPVDPVKLNIPDYFSIIKNPMDLGTVKENLLKRKYTRTVQFSEDVMLTFSNAMLYNPPKNEVHFMAKKLSNLFDARWRLLEDKWAKETFNSNVGRVDDKSRLAEVGPPKKKPSKDIRTLVQCPPPASCKGEGADKSHSGIRIEKSNGRLILKLSSCNRLLGANNEKCSSRDAISHNSTLPKKEASVTPQKLGVTRLPICDKISTAAGSCGIRQHELLPITSLAVASEKEVDEIPLEEPLSPSRALRAAMLKSRFADTIVKAQQRALLDQGKNVDPIKLQLEREKLERRQQEEKVRLEAKVRAAQAAARKKAEEDRKLKREKEREAARLALQQVKKTVDLDNTELIKELERMTCSWNCHMRKTDEFKQNMACGIQMKSGFLNPLEKLGLFIKADDFDDEDLVVPAKADVEEGEIC
ncbi:transcription factor GTE12-like [Carex rostrata]